MFLLSEKKRSAGRCEDVADGPVDAAVTSPINKQQDVVPSLARRSRECSFNSEGKLDENSVAMNKDTLPATPIPVVQLSPRSSTYSTTPTSTQRGAEANSDGVDWVARKKTSKITPVITSPVAMFSTDKADARAVNTSVKKPRETLPPSPEVVLNVSNKNLNRDDEASSLREWKSSEVMLTETHASGKRSPIEQPSLRTSTDPDQQQRRRNVHSLPSNIGSSRMDYRKTTLPPSTPVSVDIGKKQKLEIETTQTWVTMQRLSPEIKVSRTEMFKDTSEVAPVAVLKLPDKTNTKEVTKEVKSPIEVREVKLPPKQEMTPRQTYQSKNESSIEVKEVKLPPKQDLTTRQTYQSKNESSIEVKEVKLPPKQDLTKRQTYQSKNESSTEVKEVKLPPKQDLTKRQTYQSKNESSTEVKEVKLPPKQDLTTRQTYQSKNESSGIQSKVQALTKTSTFQSTAETSKVSVGISKVSVPSTSTVGVNSSGIPYVGGFKASSEEIHQNVKPRKSTDINTSSLGKPNQEKVYVSKPKNVESHKTSLSKNATHVKTVTDVDTPVASLPNPYSPRRDKLETSVVSRLESTGLRRDTHETVKEKHNDNVSYAKQNTSVIKTTESSGRSNTDKEHNTVSKSKGLAQASHGQDSSAPLVSDDKIAGLHISDKKESVDIGNQQTSAVIRDSEQERKVNMNRLPTTAASTETDLSHSVVQDKIHKQIDQSAQLQKEYYKFVAEMNPDMENVISNIGISSKTKTTIGFNVQNMSSEAKSNNRDEASSKDILKKEATHPTVKSSVSTLLNSGADSKHIKADKKEATGGIGDISLDSNKSPSRFVHIIDSNSKDDEISSPGKTITIGDVRNTDKYSDLVDSSQQKMIDSKSSKKHVTKDVGSKSDITRASVMSENTTPAVGNSTAKRHMEGNVHSSTSHDAVDVVNHGLDENDAASVGDVGGSDETWITEDLSYHSLPRNTGIRNRSANIPEVQSPSLKQTHLLDIEVDSGTEKKHSTVNQEEGYISERSSKFLILIC